MLTLIRLSSLSKEYFDLQDTARRQKKTVSVMKLVTVSVICFLAIALYALRVNQASTKGYFLKQETRAYDALVFQRSIAQLDALKLERKLYDQVLKTRGSWYVDEDRRIILTIGKPAVDQMVKIGEFGE